MFLDNPTNFVFIFQFSVLVFNKWRWFYPNQGALVALLRPVYPSSRFSSSHTAAMLNACHQSRPPLWYQWIVFDTWWCRLEMIRTYHVFPGSSSNPPWYPNYFHDYRFQLFPICCYRWLRKALCDECYFGEDPDQQAQLDLGYASFKSFCKREGIQCSQPPFKTYHVTW